MSPTQFNSKNWLAHTVLTVKALAALGGKESTRIACANSEWSSLKDALIAFVENLKVTVNEGLLSVDNFDSMYEAATGDRSFPDGTTALASACAAAPYWALDTRSDTKDIDLVCVADSTCALGKGSMTDANLIDVMKNYAASHYRDAKAGVKIGGTSKDLHQALARIVELDDYARGDPRKFPHHILYVTSFNDGWVHQGRAKKVPDAIRYSRSSGSRGLSKEVPARYDHSML